jgi:hypothetical protein
MQHPVVTQVVSNAKEALVAFFRIKTGGRRFQKDRNRQYKYTVTQ